jgi:hypothetical protein
MRGCAKGGQKRQMQMFGKTVYQTDARIRATFNDLLAGPM